MSVNMQRCVSYKFTLSLSQHVSASCGHLQVLDKERRKQRCILTDIRKLNNYLLNATGCSSNVGDLVLLGESIVGLVDFLLNVLSSCSSASLVEALV
jgi:hypothetical protein